MFRKILKNVVFLFLIMSIFTFFVHEKTFYLMGLAIGTLTSILLFKLIQINADRILFNSKRKAKFISFSNYIIRFMIYGIVMTISVILSMTMLLGTVLGLMTVKISIYIEGIGQITNDR